MMDYYAYFYIFTIGHKYYVFRNSSCNLKNNIFHMCVFLNTNIILSNFFSLSTNFTAIFPAQRQFIRDKWII